MCERFKVETKVASECSQCHFDKKKLYLSSSSFSELHGILLKHILKQPHWKIFAFFCRSLLILKSFTIKFGSQNSFATFNARNKHNQFIERKIENHPTSKVTFIFYRPRIKAQKLFLFRFLLISKCFFKSKYSNSVIKLYGFLFKSI